MVSRTFRVFMGAVAIPVGALRFDAEGNRESSSFEYDPGWIASSDAYEIDPGLLLQPGPFYRKGGKSKSPFHGAIADTAPDGWGKRVLQRDMAKRRKTANEEVAPLTAIDFLVGVDDRSRLGALRFQDETGTFVRAVPEGRRSVPPMMELKDLLKASNAIERNTETAEDLAFMMGKGTSLDGLRPKCSVIDEGGRLWIAKFPSVGDQRSVTRAEALALALARMAGIDAASARIVEADGAPVTLVKRFDRSDDGKRIMFVSAMTLLGIDDDDDHSYTEIVEAIRSHGASPERDMAELWRRIVFSILVTNVDDHLKNHGFLRSGGPGWALSPAYDVNPMPDKARFLKTWISEDTGSEARIDSALAASRYFGLSIEQARTMIGEVADAVDQWRTIGASPAIGMSKSELEEFESAFQHPERAEATRARQPKVSVPAKTPSSGP